MGSRRLLVLLGVGAPLVGLLALLGWALYRGKGQPVSVVVRNEPQWVQVVNRPAPDFTLTLLDGSPLRLSSLRGKVVMVDFWSSWCPPCIAEAPTLRQVYLEYAPRGVEFVGVAIWDTEEAVRRFVRDSGTPYPVGLDEKGRLAIEYGVAGIPEKFFLDPQGVLRRKFIGAISADELRGVLDSLLAPGD